MDDEKHLNECDSDTKIITPDGRDNTKLLMTSLTAVSLAHVDSPDTSSISDFAADFNLVKRMLSHNYVRPDWRAFI
jgi:hypothetical protein